MALLAGDDGCTEKDDEHPAHALAATGPAGWTPAFLGGQPNHERPIHTKWGPLHHLEELFCQENRVHFSHAQPATGGGTPGPKLLLVN